MIEIRPASYVGEGEAWHRTVHDRKNDVEGELQRDKYVISSRMCINITKQDVMVKYAG
jgi:hypothetical protein